MTKRKRAERKNKKNFSKNILPEKTSLWGRARSSRFLFSAAFSLCCVGLYLVLNALPQSVIQSINEHVAATLVLVLNFFGLTVSVANDIVFGYGLSFQITLECTPIFSAGLFLCFVAFHPATLLQKATGLAFGIPALYSGNLFRLAATFMISRYDRGLFELVHVYLGQVFTIFLVILVCVVWLRWLDRDETKQSIPIKEVGFLARFALISGCLFLVWINIHHWYIWLLDRFMIFGFSCSITISTLRVILLSTMKPSALSLVLLLFLRPGQYR